MKLEEIGNKKIKWTLKKKLLLWLTCIYFIVQVILIISSTLVFDKLIIYIDVLEFEEVVNELRNDENIISISENKIDLNASLGGITYYDDGQNPIKPREINESDLYDINEFINAYPEKTYVKVRGDELILAATINDSFTIINSKQLAIVYSLRKMFNVYLGVTTIISFLALFISTYFFLGYFLNPIIKIQDATRRIANFEFEKNLVIETNDELEDLANSINTMSAELKLNMNKIIEKEVLYSLGETVDVHFSENGNHIKRVSLMMYNFSKSLGYMEETCEMLKTASTMHDIGKIAISDDILKKPGKLTSAEYKIMKTHTTEGERILGKSFLPTMKLATEIALNHHERIDGKGYPKQLSGDEIPKSAKMMAIIDVYDALVNERVYKEAFDQEESIKILIEGRGSQFDADLLDQFLENIEKITVC